MAILTFYEYLSQHKSAGDVTLGLYLDLSKAFDCVNHEILLAKLNNYGIRGPAQNLIKSYLENRNQCVKIHNTLSDSSPISLGVPQGSVLGPLLFLIYCNDIHKFSSKFKTLLFADDTTLLYSSKNLNNEIHIINSELAKLSTWFQSNKLTLNISKTHFQLYNSPSSFSTDSINIFLNDQPIQHNPTVKFLGVYLDENMKWSSHISKLCSTVARNTGVLRRARHFISQSSALSLYNCLILPHFNYAITTWGHNFKSHLSHVILLQKRAIRVVSNSSYLSHTDPLFTSHKILKIPFLVKYHTLIFMLV